MAIVTRKQVMHEYLALLADCTNESDYQDVEVSLPQYLASAMAYRAGLSAREAMKVGHNARCYANL